MYLNLDSWEKRVTFVLDFRTNTNLIMKVLKDQLTRTMLENLNFVQDVVLKNLENNGTIDGNYGKRSANPGELERLEEITLAHPERAMAYTEMAADPQKMMKEWVSRELTKIMPIMQEVFGVEDATIDERTTEVLKNMNGVLRKALDAYKGPMAEFVCVSDNVPQVVALMHAFLDNKSGRSAIVYVKAFMELKLIEKPTLEALTTEFPHIGNKSALNDCFNARSVRIISVKEVKNAMEVIRTHPLAKELGC